MFINDIKPVHRERDRGMEIYCKLEGLDSEYIRAKIALENNSVSSAKSEVNYLRQAVDKLRDALKKIADSFFLKRLLKKSKKIENLRSIK